MSCNYKRRCRTLARIEKCLGENEKSFVVCTCPSEWLSWQSLRLRRIGLTATGSLVIKTNPCTSHCSKSLPYGWKCWIPTAKTLPCYSVICQSKIRNCGGSGGHSPNLAAIILIFILTLSHFQLSKPAFERLLSSTTCSISLTLAWESVNHDFCFIALYDTVTLRCMEFVGYK